MKLWFLNGPGLAEHNWWLSIIAESEERALEIAGDYFRGGYRDRLAWPVAGMRVESFSLNEERPVFFSTGGCAQHSISEAVK